jgi:hypothetical protein
MKEKRIVRKINIRENQWGNREWSIQRHRQNWGKI